MIHSPAPVPEPSAPEDRPGFPYVAPWLVCPPELKFLDGLKQSMRHRILCGVPAAIADKSHDLSVFFGVRFSIHVASAVCSYAILDAGLAERPEFVFPPGVVGNGRFAYVGDAFLTARITLVAALAGLSARDQTKLRSDVSSRKSLYAYWQKCVRVAPVTWESILHEEAVPTPNQCAEFVEAAIGCCVLTQNLRAANALIDDVIRFAVRESGVTNPQLLTFEIPA